MVIIDGNENFTEGGVEERIEAAESQSVATANTVGNQVGAVGSQAKKESGGPLGRIIAVSVASAVVGGLVAVGGFAAYLQTQPQDATTKVVVAGTPASRQVVSVKQAGKLLAPQDIYDQYGPAVVHISANISARGYSEGFYSIPQHQGGGVSTGSGFVVDPAGYVVTNAHVVENSNEVSVTLSNKKEFPAKVVGIDTSSDVALLKITPGNEPLTVIQLGDSSKVRVGDTVYAIGNPLGFDGSMSSGIVSALSREIDAPNGFKIRNALQTDAAINQGNSGGPLIDAYGQVIGVNSQIVSNSGGFEGIAFAIPSNMVKNIVSELKSKGKAAHAWLGISGQDLTPDLADKLKVKAEKGVVISSAMQGGPAEKAGLNGFSQAGMTDASVGDIILKLDGKQLSSMSELQEVIDQHRAGDKVKLLILRNGKEQTINVTLGDRPQTIDINQ